MKAKRTLVASVVEREGDITDGIRDITRQLAWSGIPAEAKLINPSGRAPQELLADAAKACGADLVVMGAYGHSRLREVLFGGCTQAFIRDADRPVLLMH
jgi:nucleotide-binding universal stress UspA family protein